MEWPELLQQMADYVSNSGFTVKVDEKLPTVAIDNAETDQGFFLQGENAEAFITDVDDLWEKAGVVDYDVVELAVAKQYIDCLDGNN